MPFPGLSPGPTDTWQNKAQGHSASRSAVRAKYTPRPTTPMPSNVREECTLTRPESETDFPNSKTQENETVVSDGNTADPDIGETIETDEPNFLFYLDDLAFNLQGLCFIGVLPKNLTTTKSLLEAIAQEMRFPDYFGKNWNALIDCLSCVDEVVPADVFALVHQDLPLADDLEELQIYIEVLRDCCRRMDYYSDKQLLIVFPLASLDLIRHLMAKHKRENDLQERTFDLLGFDAFDDPWTEEERQKVLSILGPEAFETPAARRLRDRTNKSPGDNEEG
jgi:hypothetical protein